MEDYIFVCPECKVILTCDEAIELHSQCNSSGYSGVYWLEEYILDNLDYFINIKKEIQ